MDHEILFQRILYQLPKELNWLKDHVNWVNSRGYVIKGVRAIIWGRVEEGETYLMKALKYGVQVDRLFLSQLSSQVTSYETEFGKHMAQNVINNLSQCLEKLTNRAEIRWFKGVYAVNTAFKSYQHGEYANVPHSVLSSIINDPSYLVNRGVLKIFLSSLVKLKN